MRNDEITAALEAAIEEARSLNQKAGDVLEKAIKVAVREMDLIDDYRYKAAKKMLDVHLRSHNVEAHYQIAKARKAKAANRKS